MAKNKNSKAIKKNDAALKKDKVYHNPLSTVWGKILIVFLCFLMVAGILASLIYLLYQMSQNV